MKIYRVNSGLLCCRFAQAWFFQPGIKKEQTTTHYTKLDLLGFRLTVYVPVDNTYCMTRQTCDARRAGNDDVKLCKMAPSHLGLRLSTSLSCSTKQITLRSFCKPLILMLLRTGFRLCDFMDQGNRQSKSGWPSQWGELNET